MEENNLTVPDSIHLRELVFFKRLRDSFLSEHDIYMIMNNLIKNDFKLLYGNEYKTEDNHIVTPRNINQLFNLYQRGLITHYKDIEKLSTSKTIWKTMQNKRDPWINKIYANFSWPGVELKPPCESSIRHYKKHGRTL